MEKTDKILLLERVRRKPIEQILEDVDNRHKRQTQRAADLGVSVVTYRKWKAEAKLATAKQGDTHDEETN